MSLKANISLLEGIRNARSKAWIVEATFRDSTQVSSTVRGYDSGTVYFGAEFQWPMGRRLETNWNEARNEEVDMLYIRVYQHPLIGANRLVGQTTVVLQELLNRPVIQFTEQLLDRNYAKLPVHIKFDLEYASPDAAAADIHAVDFDYPVKPLRPGRVPSKDGSQGSSYEAHGMDRVAPEDAEAEDDEDGSDVPNFGHLIKTIGVPPVLGQTMHKEEEFQILVTIRKATKLIAKPPVNPRIQVQIDEEIQETEIKLSNLNPEYNHFMPFEFKKTRADLFDHVIEIRALNMGNALIPVTKGTMKFPQFLPENIIGEFRIDVKTVYEAKNHSLIGKRAVLIDPKNFDDGRERGRVSLSIQVQDQVNRSKSGMRAMAAALLAQEDSSDDEGNLLLSTVYPSYCSRRFGIVALYVKIFQAEDLPRMSTDALAAFKHIFNRNKQICDPYVRVSFGGHSERTDTKSDRYDPVWNQQITIVERWPPLCNRIRIGMYDSSIKDECIATHFISLPEIMEVGNDGGGFGIGGVAAAGGASQGDVERGFGLRLKTKGSAADKRTPQQAATDGYLPTFGPSWINLYGSPRNYSLSDMTEQERLNLSLGEGVSYRGRLLVQVSASDKTEATKFGAKKGGFNVPITTKYREDFLLIGVFFEVGSISKECCNLPISFEMSIGKYGYRQDGTNPDEGEIEKRQEKKDKDKDKTEDSNMMDSDEDPEDDDTPVPMWCHSETKPERPIRSRAHEEDEDDPCEDEEYYCLPYETNKPCLYIRCRYEDNRPRMYITNILETLYRQLSLDLDEVQQYIDVNSKRKKREMRNTLRTLLTKLAQSSECVSACRGTGIRTQLDQRRKARIKMILAQAQTKVSLLLRQLNLNNVQQVLDDCRTLSRILKNLSADPQDALPDVFLWMNVHSDLRKKKRVAFARIPARQIIHSFVEDERGKDCGRLSSVFLRRPGSQGIGEGGRKLPAALRMYFWLGKLKDIRFYISDLPGGYNKNCFYSQQSESNAVRMRKCPPKYIEYFEQSTFEFRAYIFSARKVLRSDESGLSDVFLRVIINNQVFTTPVIKQTLSPQWDVTLRAPVTFSFSEMAIHASPPVIIVEVFDDDQDDTETWGAASLKDAEFLGRCFCKPKVVLRPDASANEEWSPPLLEWWPIYRTQRPAGELLASFELIEMVDGTPVPGIETITKVLPANIKSVEELLEEDEPDPKEKARGRPPGLLQVPKQIRPKLVPYRLEVLIWGLRDLLPLKNRFGRPTEPPQNPSVLVEFGGKIIETKRLDKYSECANFKIEDRLIKHCDIMLPEKRWYWPALTFKCEQTPVDQSSSAAETIYIGNTVVSIDEIQLLEDEKATEDEHDHSEHEHSHKHSHGNAGDHEPDQEHRHDEAGQLDDYQEDEAEAGDVQSHSHSKSRAASRMTASRRSSVRSTAIRSVVSRRGGEGGSKMEGYDNPAMAGRGLDTVDDVATSGPVVGFQTGDFVAGDQHRRHHQHNGKEDKQKLTSAVNFNPDDVLFGEMNNGEEPGEVLAEIEPPPKPPKNAQLADWWHRFYLSQLVQQEELANADTVDVADEAELLAGIEAKVSETSEADEFEEIDDKKRKKKQKKKRKKKLKKIKSKVRRKPPLNPMAKSTKELYHEAVKQDSDEERVDSQRRMDEDFTWVPPIPILGGCLEDEPEFEKFADCLQSFPLYTGKEETDDVVESGHQRSGTLKAKVCLYKLCESQFNAYYVDSLRLERYLPVDFTVKDKKVKSRGITGDIDVTVRVYVIQCNNLLPRDENGTSDPYLLVQLGEHKQNFREEKISKDLNPVFGKMVEFANVKFPKDSLLRVQVYDFDARPEGLWSDELLGETVIDLENRLFSKHRGHCGLQEEYTENGCNRWRDSQKPSEILAGLCERHGLKKPIYEAIQNRVTVGDETFYTSATIYDEKGDAYSSKEPLALHVLHSWDQSNLGGYPLVKEHLESRPLFTPAKPEIEQGRVLMWVDVFPLTFGDLQAPVNIMPREPVGYELRVIIYDTKDVIAADSSFLTGIESTDIYVKGFMIGEAEDGQKTDTHKNSETGEGNFNYRFVFKFKYIKAENKILYESETGLLDRSEPQKKRSTCQLTLKLFDENMFLRDLELGEIAFKLTEIPVPPPNASECDIFMINPEDEAYRTVRTLNLFDRPRVKGWFPFMGKERKYEGSEEYPILAGVVNMELELLTAAAAESDPVGLGREEPHPLPEPNRPERSLLKLLNPLNTLKFLAKKFRSFLIKLAIIIPIVLIFVLLIYSTPGLVMRKIFGV